MELKRYLKALPAVAALLLTASCSSDNNNEIVEAPQPAQALMPERLVSSLILGSNTTAKPAPCTVTLLTLREL